MAWTPDAPWSMRFDDVCEKFGREPLIAITPENFLLFMGEPTDAKSVEKFAETEVWKGVGWKLARRREQLQSPEAKTAEAYRLLKNERRAREGEAKRATAYAAIQANAVQDSVEARTKGLTGWTKSGLKIGDTFTITGTYASDPVPRASKPRKPKLAPLPVLGAPRAYFRD